MTTENRKGIKDKSTSNVSHVSRKPLQCTDVTTPYAGHLFEVTFRNHCNDYDLFSIRTWLSFSLYSGEKIMLYSKDFCPHCVFCFFDLNGVHCFVFFSDNLLFDFLCVNLNKIISITRTSAI